MPRTSNSRNLINNTVENYPQFDLGIPDQFRFDIWNEAFQNDATNGAVPELEFMWISSDHTGGPPTEQAMQADNDLALGRYVHYPYRDPSGKALRAGWMAKKAEVFAGKQHTPDSEDSDTVNHLNWYEATGFTRPYPAERTVRPESDFNREAPAKADDDD